MAPKEPASPPNIVLILTDQQRFDTIRALGFDHVDTPNLDRLVNEGTSFNRCYVTAPSCAPSRASLFTGLYPHTCGVMKNMDRWEHSWVERLNEGGYHCANIGKMHSCPFEAPMGFHERFVVENKDRYLEGREFQDQWDQIFTARGQRKQQRELYRLRDDYRESLGAFLWEMGEDTHSDNFVGNAASRWIENYEQPKPFFLQVGFPGPHPPYDPTPRFAEQYKDRDIPLDPVTESDLANQPQALKDLRQHNCDIDHDSVVHLKDPSEAARLRQRQYYMANVSMIDEQVGEIIANLEKTDQLDNTLIIFTSDHGDCLTDHGHSQKWTMYEQSVHVPLIVWSPGRVAAGRKVDGLCQLMDVGPTILETAGVDIPDYFAARTLTPAFGETDEWAPRKYAVCEQIGDATLTGTKFETMICDERWKLVHFVDDEAGQLFDLQTDPREHQNRWNDPDAAGEKSRLLDELLRWRIETTAISANHNADHR